MEGLGVGLVYWPALAPLFEAGRDAPAVLELEPETLWEKRAEPSAPADIAYRINDALLERIARLPQRKLLHGVGHPVGGATDDPHEYVAPLARMVEALDPAWVSEHLSFNRVRAGEEVHDAGFLLPPRQSRAGVCQAVRNIDRRARALGRPFAFETGVSYLSRRYDELPDGEFFAAVAEQADCGILLDLHNLWCNARNGRQPVEDALAQMPFERVWEVHLAGGMALDGFWLDAHSDAVPMPVLDLAERVIPRLPNLGALIFEILPQHLPRIGIDGVAREVERLRSLWALRPAPSRNVVGVRSRPHFAAPTASDEAELLDWERALARAIAGLPIDSARFADLGSDAGADVLRTLIGEFRRASLARALRYTLTGLLAALGPDDARRLLDTYCAQCPADAFAAVEADRFANFLRGRAEVLDRVPYLRETLAFEHALIRATLFGACTDLVWSADPTEIFAALDAGRLPRDLPPLRSEMRVTVE